WAEQLLAESTGKRGVGIVPVDLEPLGSVDNYGDDRAFVRLTLAGSEGLAGADKLVNALNAAGHPVIRIELRDRVDIAGEFIRWEVATRTPTWRSRRSSPRRRRATPRWPGAASCCVTTPAAPRPPATARASSTRPASSTRAARQSAGSSS